MVLVKDNAAAQTNAPFTVETMIQAAERIIASSPQLFAHSERENKKELNVRLIRDYVVREFIPRPERLGREARFGMDHLVQLLAVRVLLRSQKWSLPAIKASFLTTGREDLLNSLLSPVRTAVETEFRKASGVKGGRPRPVSASIQTPSLNPAQLLIEKFKATKQSESRSSSSSRLRRPNASNAAPGVLILASPVTPRAGGKSKLHIELEPWCELVIDAQNLRSLTSKEIDRLGEMLKIRLKDKTTLY